MNLPSPTGTPGPSHAKRAFARSLGAFASATFLSRILGYIRDALVASYFGGGFVTDAFYAAFRIPNLLRRFLGEGSLTSAFVPVFTETLHKKGKEEAQAFLSALTTALLLLLSALVVLGIVFAPQLTQLMTWGFTRDPDKFALTVQLTRLTFPFLLIISFAALGTAVLNTCGRFFVPAVAPSGLSIGEIAFILFLASRCSSPIEGLAVSAVVGVGIHFVWQLPYMIREGFRFRLGNPWSHPEVKRVFLLMIPTIIGLAADQVNSFVDQVCGSFLREGSITALYNSNRVMQLPLALFGVAVSSVSLPALSQAASKEDKGEFRDLIGLSLRLANFVLIPSVVGLSVLGLPIVKLLFQHGRFTPEQSRLTYDGLVAFSIGLPAYSACRVLASAFYARKDTKTPMKIAFAAMFVNVIGDVTLMWPFGVGGLAFSTSASAWAQAVGLFVALRRREGRLDGRAIASSFLWASAAGLGMGILCRYSDAVLLAKLPLALRVVLSVAIGAAAYVGVAKLLRVREFESAWAALRRRRGI